jgi:hypothetical protein
MWKSGGFSAASRSMDDVGFSPVVAFPNNLHHQNRQRQQSPPGPSFHNPQRATILFVQKPINRL